MLLTADRLELAEQEVRRAITEEPNDAYLHCLLGVTLHRKRRLNEAEQVLRHSIELDPEEDNTFAQLGLVLNDRNQFKPAMEAIEEAIRLNPEDADHFGFKASFLYGKGKWSDSLQAARTGLEIDAENETCRLFYSLSLSALGDTEAADAEALSLLNDDPDSADSQITRGLVLMESNPKLAQQHFLEALRIDPTEETARIGLANTMKLQNPVFGWFMKALVWIDKFPLWGIFLVLLVGSRIARFLGKTGVPGVTAAGKLVYFLMMLFCMITLIQRPLFDLLLYLNPSGRNALDRKVRDGMKWICFAMIAGLGFAVWSIFDGRSTAMLHAFLWCGVAGLVYEVLSADHPWVQKRLLWITLLAVAIGGGFLAYDLGIFRPRSRAAETANLAQMQTEFKELFENGSIPEPKPGTDSPPLPEEVLAKLHQIGAQNDKQLSTELGDIRRTLLFFWGPLVLAIVLASSWSDEITEYLYGKAPDQ